jgi:hypothetical protein
MILKICYLCGEGLEGDINQDHTISKHLVIGQPKRRGFDYGGKIEVHRKCNSFFGNRSSNIETISQKAMQFLKIMFDPNKAIHRVKKNDPELEILAIEEKHINNFTKDDFTFFKLRDVRNEDYKTITSKEFINQYPKVNPLEKPLNVAITVLAKNCAAMLFKRNHFYPTDKWRIFATTFWGDKDIDYDTILGKTKPFEIGVKLWIKQYQSGDWFCAYKLDELQIYFVFLNSSNYQNIYELRVILKDAETYYFESDKLINLIDYNWFQYKFK